MFDFLTDGKGAFQTMADLYAFNGDLSLPYSDWGSCHTLEEVRIEYVDENGVTWDVELNREAFKTEE